MHFMKIGILLIGLPVLFGCSNEAIQNNPITQKAMEIETLVNQSKWDKAKQKVKITREYFQITSGNINY